MLPSSLPPLFSPFLGCIEDGVGRSFCSEVGRSFPVNSSESLADPAAQEHVPLQQQQPALHL